MTKRGLSPIVCVLAMLLASVPGRAAEEPAATAVIPPPAPPVAVHKPISTAAVHKPPQATVHKPSPPAAVKAAAGSRAHPRHITAATKKNPRTGTRVAGVRKPDAIAQHHARHRASEHRPVVVRSAPPPPAGLPRDYAGVPMLGPDGPPPLPPPWYDRARPAIAFAYPPPFMGRRGPMPWWVR